MMILRRLYLPISSPFSSNSSILHFCSAVSSPSAVTTDRNRTTATPSPVNAITNEQLKSAGNSKKSRTRRRVANDGPSLDYFIAKANAVGGSVVKNDGASTSESVPYIPDEMLLGNGRKVLFETYGCQMNVSDMEIVRSVLVDSRYIETTDSSQADVILLMTCAIRDGAEQKIWNRLKNLRREFRKSSRSVTIGILGCMAERLKERMLEKERLIDVVAGPDSYRDLPRLLAITRHGQSAVNVLLSLDETYADITPVRHEFGSVTAFVSIMRGCDNMCTYCIVPFTRGRERSRPVESILSEIRQLSEQGVKEVTLLGQNVNSYRDVSGDVQDGVDQVDESATSTVDGFRTVYKPKRGGQRFGDLLRKVAAIDPEMRIRFTSPHPKDFSDDIIHAIRDHPNICNKLHMPAQSGNDGILEAMGRGYTAELYLQLVAHIKSILPDVSITSDFISGFCGESESAHEDTIKLMRQVQYNFAYCFAYSMREKTRAHRRLVDDIPQLVKNQRCNQLHTVFQEEARVLNKRQIGNTHLVLVEGLSRRSDQDVKGRNDGGTSVLIDNRGQTRGEGVLDAESRHLTVGDYVVCKVTDYTSHHLKARPIIRTSLSHYASYWQ